MLKFLLGFLVGAASADRSVEPVASSSSRVFIHDDDVFVSSGDALVDVAHFFHRHHLGDDSFDEVV